MSFERRLLLGAAIVWIVVTALAIASGPPLGHDEAAYAIGARGGGPAWLYRPAGVIELAKIGVAWGGAAWQLRIASAIVGIGVMFATWAVGRATFGERVGAWAAAVIAGAHPMVLRSAELLGDLPATACVLAGIAVLAGELRREEGPSWRLVAAAPALAAGFYMRYGNAPVIAVIAALALLLWWRSMLRRPLPVVVTAALLAGLLAPHAIESLRTTGSWFGILEVSAAMPRRAYFGEGLVTYLKWVPMFWFGALVTPMMVVGAGALVKARNRPALFVGAIAIAQILMIGVKSHAQPRYIFIATALLVVLGVECTLRYVRERIVLALVAASWLAVVVAIVPYQLHLATLRRPLYRAAIAIRDDAHGESCAVIAKVVTQLMWYAGCEDVLLRDPATLRDQLKDRPAQRLYVVSAPHATTGIDAITSALGGQPRVVDTGDNESKAWALANAR